LKFPGSIPQLHLHRCWLGLWLSGRRVATAKIGAIDLPVLKQSCKPEVANPLAALTKSATNADKKSIPLLEWVSFRHKNA
jgi:hypothetical protein